MKRKKLIFLRKDLKISWTTNLIRRMTRNQILECNFVCPKGKTIQKKSKFSLCYQREFTNGNEAILNGHIDFKMPGGTRSILPLNCITKFVFIVPSKFVSALKRKSNRKISLEVFLPGVEIDIRRPDAFTWYTNGLNTAEIFRFPL